MNYPVQIMKKTSVLLEKEGQTSWWNRFDQNENPWLLYFLKFNPETYLSKLFQY
jgi:hypothetical protein